MVDNNILYPLVDSIYNLGQLIYNKLAHKELPNYISYQVDNTIHLENGSLFIPIGQSKHNTQYLNISGENVNSYIVGQSGSGKSNLTKVILSSIVNNYPNVQLYLLDYKRVELSLFKNTTNCIRYEWDSEAIEQALNDLLELILDRYSILELEGYTNAIDYNKTYNYSMNTILCVIEEVALMPKSTMKILRKIMAICRATNIFILFTTQRPSREILDNVVKSLVGNRICLKCEDINNSVISLGVEGCELLRGKGHGYYKANGNIYEFQSYYITDEQVKSIVNKHLKVNDDLYAKQVKTYLNMNYVDNLASSNDLKTGDTSFQDNENTDWIDKL